MEDWNVAELRRAVAKRASQNLEFRKHLEEDAQSAIQHAFGVSVDVDINVHINTSEERHFSIPHDESIQDAFPNLESIVQNGINSSRKPIVSKTRLFRGEPELLTVFYTKRCRYQCSFCTLPWQSAHHLVEFEDVETQLDVAFLNALHSLSRVERVSFGNEGSILDEDTFPRSHLGFALQRTARLPSVHTFALETRHEFVTPERLDFVQSLIGDCTLEMKIGLESLSESVREDVLGKRMDLREFERVVAELGRRNIRLSCYVLMGADPRHSPAEARHETMATCRYLIELCDELNTDLLIRINPMYCAEGSPWAKRAKKHDWTPPSIRDIAAVTRTLADKGVAVYVGLSDEGLAEEGGTYQSRSDYDSTLHDALHTYNRTQNLSELDNWSLPKV